MAAIAEAAAAAGGGTAGSRETALVALTGIRLGLSFAGLGAATAVTSGRTAFLGWALGAIGCALFVVADPRRKLNAAWQSGSGRSRPRHPSLEKSPEEGSALPTETWWKHALRAMLPSTVGVAILCAIALPFSGVLAAICAGTLAGLAIGGVVAAFA